MCVMPMNHVLTLINMFIRACLLYSMVEYSSDELEIDQCRCNKKKIDKCLMKALFWSPLFFSVYLLNFFFLTENMRFIERGLICQKQSAAYS